MSTQAMTCQAFNDLLNPLLDGELDQVTTRAMHEHMEHCAPCKQLYQQMSDILAQCNALDTQTVMPLTCQASWRRAVRQEADKQQIKTKRAPWVRSLGAAAAVVAVLFTSTIYMRQSQAPRLNAGTTTHMQNSMTSQEIADLSAGVAGTSADSPVLHLETDGNTTNTGTLTNSNTNTSSPQTTGDSQKTEQTEQAPILIHSVELRLQTDQFSANMQNLDDLVDEYKAYFELRSRDAQNTPRTIQAVIRVPVDSLNEFVQAVSNLGTVVLEEHQAENITRQYRHNEERLATLKKQEARLNELLPVANSAEELSSLGTQLDECHAEIEKLQTLQQNDENRVRYAKVTVSLVETTLPPEVSSEQEASPAASLGQRVRQGFAHSWQQTLQFLKDMVVAVATYAPQIVLGLAGIGILWFVLYKIFKRKP